MSVIIIATVKTNVVVEATMMPISQGLFLDTPLGLDVVDNVGIAVERT